MNATLEASAIGYTINGKGQWERKSSGVGGIYAYANNYFASRATDGGERYPNMAIVEADAEGSGGYAIGVQTTRKKYDGRPRSKFTPQDVLSDGFLTAGAIVLAGGGIEDVPADLVALGRIGVFVVEVGVLWTVGNYAANSTPSVPYPTDPTQAPGEGWEWRGRAGSNDGSWYNPNTKERLNPDLDHPDPIGPHWDYKTPEGKWRWYPDGRLEPK